jgi:stage III sporulation protein AB
MAALLLASLAGSALIVGSTTYAGWQIAGRYSRRPRELRDLQTAIAILQTEVEYGATPLPAALAQAARAAGDPIGPLFTATARRLQQGDGITPGEAMRAALAAGADETALKAEDLEVLLALAGVLGSTGRADQVRHLQLARRRLEAEEARAHEERQRFERTARYLGVLSGAALALMLWP